VMPRKNPTAVGFFRGQNATIELMFKLTTIFFTITLSVLAVLCYLAYWLHLYWRFSWFDIVLHFFAGAALTFGLFTLRDVWRRLPVWLETWPVAVGFVALVALGWEAFEIVVVGVARATPGLWLDSLLDVMVGVIGGAVGWVLARRLRAL